MLMNPYRFGGGGGANPQALAIYSSLVAFWDFEENDATTSFLDSHGGNDLASRTGGSATATSAASTSAGIVGRAFFPNTTDDKTAYIPRANTALDMPNANLSFGGWFKGLSNVSGSARFVMGRIGGADGGVQMYLGLESSDNSLHLFASTGGTIATRVDCASTKQLSPTEFNLVVATLNRGSNAIELRVRSATGSFSKFTASMPSALYTGSSTANFCINDGLSSDSSFFSGSREALSVADSCFYTSMALSDSDFDYLYNAGAGKNYAALKADAGF